MSSIEEGRRIHCDGAACEATATIPVALRPALLTSTRAMAAPRDWLYVLKTGSAEHYCPVCARAFLADHREITIRKAARLPVPE